MKKKINKWWEEKKWRKIKIMFLRMRKETKNEKSKNKDDVINTLCLFCFIIYSKSLFVCLFIPFHYLSHSYTLICIICGQRSSQLVFRRSTGNDVSGHYKQHYFLFSPLSTFLIEGVLRSKILFSKSRWQEKEKKKEKTIMLFIVATNVVASQPTNVDRLERRALMPKLG